MEPTYKQREVQKPLAKTTMRSRPSTKTLLFRSTPCSTADVESNALKNCVSTLEATAQLLTEELDGAPRERVQRMQAELARLRRLVRHEHQLDAERATDATMVDARKLVEEVCSRLRDRADLKGVVLVTRVRCSALQVRRESFAEAIFNLVSNAIDATTAGTVTIEVHQGEGGDVLLQVSDAGRGMSREALASLGHEVPPALGGGGLGVQLASAFVERHGGLVHFESEPGAGTTASIWLPSCGEASAELTG